MSLAEDRSLPFDQHPFPAGLRREHAAGEEGSEPGARAGSVERDTAVEAWLLDLYDRMLGDVDLPEVLRHLADVACQDMHAERASIFLVDRQTNELASVAVIGNVARTIRIPISNASLAGFCAASGRAFIVPDAYGDLSAIDPRLRFDGRWDAENRFRTRDVMCAPVLFKGELTGVVQVINSKGTPFGKADLGRLCTISRLIGYALYHARLYDDLASLKQLERQKAQFMRVMVHELKSPVAGAKMLADSLQYHDAVAETDAADIIGRISCRMARLIELIRDLLQLASVKAGEPLGEIAVLDLVDATSSACEPYREQAAQKGLDLNVTLPAEPLPVRIDSQGYQLILSNLASNAVKYTPSGSVRVTLRREAGWAVLDVTDSGIGIPEADIPRLFTEFFRASNAKRQRIEGSGVGLAGAKALAERFGGQFALQTRENQGSTFTVRLPVYQG